MRLTICCLVAALLLSLACVAAQKKGDPAKGKVVFEACAPCHNVDSDARKMGPSLKGLFKRAKLENGKKVTEENVRSQINSEGRQMPHYQDILSEQEKDDLIAYLKTL
jgi:mono/diheme cytochrome c family protein